MQVLINSQQHFRPIKSMQKLKLNYPLYNINLDQISYVVKQIYIYSISFNIDVKYFTGIPNLSAAILIAHSFCIHMFSKLMDKLPI